jgi:acetylornithine deacetylase/succinyl-diaminopimelate desuccinylase-like protein
LKRLAVQAEFEVKRLDPPFDPSRTRVLETFLTAATGRSATTVSFGTEAAHLPGRETVVFGPGDMTVAQRSGEFVKVADLKECVGYLQEAIREFAR